MNKQQEAIKASVEKHIKRIEDSRKTIKKIQDIMCDHDYEYVGTINLEDYERCKICGKMNVLPKELLGVDYGQNNNK